MDKAEASLKQLASQVDDMVSRYDGNGDLPPFVPEEVLPYMVANKIKSPSEAFSKMYDLDIPVQDWRDPPDEPVTTENLRDKISKELFGFGEDTSMPGYPARLEEKPAPNHGPTRSADAWDELTKKMTEQFEEKESEDKWLV